MTPKFCLEQWEALPMKKRNGRTAKAQAKKVGMKSMLEVFIAAGLDDYGLDWDYEPEKWEYTYGIQKYTPDFRIRLPNRELWIEGKGKMTASTRKKMLAIKRCNPERDLRVIYERAKNNIMRGSKTTYAKWSDNHDFIWSDKTIPEEWFNE
jgi:hypothetical protein